MTTEKARRVRSQGYIDSLEFVSLIGLDNDYKNNMKAKKDVIDLSGDAHSVKSGQKKWQIFLYGIKRFETDEVFAVMNGMGELFMNCVNSFPLSFKEYQNNKIKYKKILKISMRALAKKLQKKARLRGFLSKAIFNSGEVNYLTVKYDNVFHVFCYKDVINVMSENLKVCNSKARIIGQFDEQKVLLRYNDRSLGEIEIRNDSEKHYREVLFSMQKKFAVMLLLKEIPYTKHYNDKVLMYGNTEKKFGRW